MPPASAAMSLGGMNYCPSPRLRNLQNAAAVLCRITATMALRWAYVSAATWTPRATVSAAMLQHLHLHTEHHAFIVCLC